MPDTDIDTSITCIFKIKTVLHRFLVLNLFPSAFSEIKYLRIGINLVIVFLSVALWHTIKQIIIQFQR